MRPADRRNGKHGVTFPFAGRNRTPERKAQRKRAMAETIRNIVQTALVVVLSVVAMATYNLTTRIDGLHQTIGGLHGDIRGMRGDIRGIRGDIREMRGDIREMRGEIDEMRGTIAPAIAGHHKP